MNNQISGTIHGKTIQLAEDPGLSDGQAVSVTVQPIAKAKPERVWGDGIRASAGAFADDPDAERLINEILAERKWDTRPEIPE
jgi:hypothetical protein